jgi:hypothetical protein
MRKFRKSVSFLLAVFLVAALLPVNAVFAAGSADTNAYTLTLEYDDNIQLLYQHKDGIAGWWTGKGDVPVGGATLNNVAAIPQLYCVDAQVPFHSEVGPMGGYSYWQGGRSVDTVPGYVAVSPDNLPDILHGHWNELSWLVMNGYSDSASVDILNGHGSGTFNGYPDLYDGLGKLGSDDGIPITADVAVMATKAAVWHYTNPDVVFLSTNFLAKSTGPKSPNGIKHRQFVALMKALIADADKYAENPSAEPAYKVPFEIAIDESRAATSPIFVSGDANYYGPYYFKTTGSAVTVGEVFLEIQGPPNSGEIGFYYNDNGTFGASILGDLQKYGGDPILDRGPGIGIGDSFYIRVPIGLDINDKRIAALTRVTGGNTNMPIVLVHQNSDGSQDWSAIQAFIGLTTGPATAYASAFLPLSGADTGNIRVSKNSGVGLGPFMFRLTDDHGKPIFLGGTGIDSEYVVNGDGEDGIFQLMHTSEAAIDLLPVDNYIVTELQSAGNEDDIVTHTVHSANFTGRVTQTIQLPLFAKTPPLFEPVADVVFTNSPYVPAHIPLTLRKLGGETGQDPFEGASFTLTGPDGVIEGPLTTDANGLLKFTRELQIPARGTDVYTLTETASPQNHFALMGTVSVKVSFTGDVEISADNSHDTGYISLNGGKGGNDAEIIVVNEPFTPPAPPEPFTPPPNPDHSIFIAKRSSAAGNPLPALPGAKFTLEKNGAVYDEAVTDEDGMLFFDLGSTGNFYGDYILTEVLPAPANHNPIAPIHFTVTGGGEITNVVTADGDSITWLDIKDNTHEYYAFRIVDTYIPPTPPSSHDYTPPPPLVPEKPEVPTEPEEPTNPAPETPDTPTPIDTDVLGHLPQTGDVADTAPPLPLMLLVLLALCGAAAILRLRGDGKRGRERQ